MNPYTVFGFFNDKTKLRYTGYLKCSSVEEVLKRVADNHPGRSITIVAVIRGTYENLMKYADVEYLEENDIREFDPIDAATGEGRR